MSDDRYMVSADDIEQMEGVQKTHFLNSNAQRVNKSLGDLVGLAQIGFHLIEVQPGHETTEHHRHHDEEECVYVLSGTATAYLDDTDVPIGPGDFIGYRKGGVAHSIRNTGDEVLRCIVVGQRLPHDTADYPRLGKRLYRNAGRPWNIVNTVDITEVGGNVGKK